MGAADRHGTVYTVISQCLSRSKEIVSSIIVELMVGRTCSPSPIHNVLRAMCCDATPPYAYMRRGAGAGYGVRGAQDTLAFYMSKNWLCYFTFSFLLYTVDIFFLFFYSRIYYSVAAAGADLATRQ